MRPTLQHWWKDMEAEGTTVISGRYSSLLACDYHLLYSVHCEVGWQDGSHFLQKRIRKPVWIMPRFIWSPQTMWENGFNSKKVCLVQCQYWTSTKEHCTNSNGGECIMLGVQHILSQNLLSTVKMLKMKMNFTSQHDNDPKHISKINQDMASEKENQSLGMTR